MTRRPGLWAVLVWPGALCAQNMQTADEWLIVPSPNAGAQTDGNTLLSVAAITPMDAWAVGYSYNAASCLTCPTPLAMHWNGSQWSLASTPAVFGTKVQLNSVAAASGSDVWAVGFAMDTNCPGICSNTVVERWDGAGWSVVPSPNPGWANLLFGVAATPTGDVWAVGYRWNDWSTWEPLIFRYRGGSWTVFDQPQYPFGQLLSVAAVAADDVWAVGVTGVISTGIEALALHWDGAAWSRVAFPAEAGGYIMLKGVSGVGASDVWAVGNYKYENLWGQTRSWARAFHWDGTGWTSVVPAVGGEDSTDVRGARGGER